MNDIYLGLFSYIFGLEYGKIHDIKRRSEWPDVLRLRSTKLACHILYLGIVVFTLSLSFRLNISSGFDLELYQQQFPKFRER
jgi:hypothetical protein